MTSQPNSPTIKEMMDEYLENVKYRSKNKHGKETNTHTTYTTALTKFKQALMYGGVDPESPIGNLNEEHVELIFKITRTLSISTERLYVTVMRDFYNYLLAEDVCMFNMAKIDRKLHYRVRSQQRRLPEFPYEQVEELVEYADKLRYQAEEDGRERLRNLRDRALIITLADTGLRIHEACNLTRGSVNLDSARSIVDGKGRKQSVVRFSDRSVEAIRDYLRERTIHLDGHFGKPLISLPLFAQHSKGSGDKVKPITTRTGQNILSERVEKALGPEYVGQITPHSLRHYFVTKIVKETNNLKLAQELARHEGMSVTQLYAHLANSELDDWYEQIFG